jgi:hypothetical protein
MCQRAWCVGVFTFSIKPKTTMFNRRIVRFNPTISVSRPADRGPHFDILCEASERGDIDQVTRLVHNLDPSDPAFSFALCFAVRWGKTDVARCLLKMGAPVTGDALRLSRTIEIFPTFRELAGWDVNDSYEGIGCCGGTILP